MKRLVIAFGVFSLLTAVVMAEDAPKADSTKPATELKSAPVKAGLEVKSDSAKAATDVKNAPVKAGQVAGKAMNEAGKAVETKKGGNWVTLKSGLKLLDEKVGTGDLAAAGTRIDVHYTGWLYENGQKGKKFDSSVDRNQPYSLILGTGAVIKGWDVGIAGMKVGGKRTLIIPPDMGYGAAGNGPRIPGNSTLIFDVELLKVTK